MKIVKKLCKMIGVLTAAAVGYFFLFRNSGKEK